MVALFETPETETIDKLFLELRQFSKARTPDELKYDRLVYEVCTKHPGEERWETALRYVRQAEQRPSFAEENYDRHK